MIKRLAFLIFLSSTVFLQMGLIRKDQDPIAMTQTDPITYKQKVEETKDGVKGAPAPSFKYYEKEGFLTQSPVNPQGEETVSPPPSYPEVSEVDLGEEDLGQEENPPAEDSLEEEETGINEDDWWVEDEEAEKESPEESGKETDLQGMEH